MLVADQSFRATLQKAGKPTLVIRDDRIWNAPRPTAGTPSWAERRPLEQSPSGQRANGVSDARSPEAPRRHIEPQRDLVLHRVQRYGPSHSWHQVRARERLSQLAQFSNQF